MSRLVVGSIAILLCVVSPKLSIRGLASIEQLQVQKKASMFIFHQSDRITTQLYFQRYANVQKARTCVSS